MKIYVFTRESYVDSEGCGECFTRAFTNKEIALEVLESEVQSFKNHCSNYKLVSSVENDKLHSYSFLTDENNIDSDNAYFSVEEIDLEKEDGVVYEPYDIFYEDIIDGLFTCIGPDVMAEDYPEIANSLREDLENDEYLSEAINNEALEIARNNELYIALETKHLSSKEV